MSRNFPGEQYEQDFIPHRLCNWEVPAVKRTSAASMYGTLNPRKEATTAIANDRGYLLSKKSKFSDSFNHNTHVYDTSAARWPKPNPLVNTGAHATMGYKGILTTYLNASTVSIPSVDIAGCKERNFH
ncbi:hypothetical protein WJX82_007870 [Trebouxia sp. C0006]